MELERLKIYTLSVDGSSCTVFRAGSPIVLEEFVYSSVRMGTSTLTATVRDWECLDALWTGREFVALDEGSLSGSSAIAGSLEKFFLLKTPSSSKSNEDERYVHTLEFVSERDVVLSNVYFCDAVGEQASSGDKYQSNNFDVTFFGTLSEFVGRFNDVLSYRGLSRFSVVIDASSIVANGVTYESAGKPGTYYAWKNGANTVYTASSMPETGSSSGDMTYVLENGSYVATGYRVTAVTVPGNEPVEVSFDKRTLFEALQQAYEAYEVPFWFDADTIHFGEGSTTVPEVTFEYGDDDELLSISRNNTGAEIVTRCTGIGGDTNIPYYYPNPTPKGTLGVGGTATGVTVANQRRFADRVALTDTLTYYGESCTSAISSVLLDGSSATLPAMVSVTAIAGGYEITQGATYRIPVTLTLNVSIPRSGWWLRVTPSFSNSSSTSVIDWTNANPSVRKYTSTKAVRELEIGGLCMTVATAKVGTTDVPFHIGKSKIITWGQDAAGNSTKHELPVSWDFFFDGFSAGQYSLVVTGYVLSSGPIRDMYYPTYTQGVVSTDFGLTAAFMTDGDSRTGWISSTGERFKALSDVGLSMSGTPSVGNTITQTQESYIRPSANLMPPIYRSSGGADRWYNAVNGTYPAPGGGNYEFANVYNAYSPREHIEEFPDIYPTIKNSNANYFDAVFFETGYNTRETVDVNGEQVQKYTYFFAKLHPLGFNLFDCAIENNDMVVEMLDGNCGSCKFKILVDKSTHQNCVQVDGSGNLVVGSDGRVVISGTPIASQNDTTSNSVWVCLGVDSTTYGDSPEAIMPNEAIRPTHPQPGQGQVDGQPVSSGDHYVLTGIALPDAYFTQAEEALKQAIIKFMAENNAEKFSYSVKFSRVYLAENPSVKAAIDAHAALTLSYAGNTLSAPLHVRQYTCRQADGEPLQEVSVELSDVIDSAPGGLQRTIAASVKDIVNVVYAGGGYGGGMSQNDSDRRYLRRDEQDTALGEITFAKGWRTDGFMQGIIGSSLTVDDDGSTQLEVDRLVVRDGTVLPPSTSVGGGDSILEVVEYDTTTTPHRYAAHLKLQAYFGSALVDLDGLYTDGFMSAGGLNANSGGGGGGVTNLWALDDVKHGSTGVLRSDGVTPVQAGDILVYGVIDDTTNPDTYGWYAKPENSAGGGGTVTSVGLQAASGSGLSVSGSPITSSGTFTIGIASGYKLPTNSEWSGKQDLIDSTHKLSYTLLSDTPTIPDAQIQSDWNQTNNSAKDYIKNKPSSLPASNVSFGAATADKVPITIGQRTENVLTAHQSLSGYLTSSDASNTYQPKNANLTAISGLSGAGVLKIASNTWSLDSNIETYAGNGNAAYGYFSSGVLPYNHGGTGQNTWTKGQILYASANNTLARLDANTGTKKFLTMTSSVPSWSAIASGDLPALYLARTQVQATPGDATICGVLGLTAASGPSVSGDQSKIVWDSVNSAWHFIGGIYSDSFISAGGLNSGGSGGGGGSSVVAYTPSYEPTVPKERILLGELSIDGTPYQIYAPANFFEAYGNTVLLDAVNFADGMEIPSGKLKAIKVETDEIDSSDTQWRVCDKDGYIVAKIDANGLLTTNVTASKTVVPKYATPDNSGFEIREDSSKSITITDANGYVLERISAGKGFYGSVKDRIIKYKNKAALSWIDDDFAIMENGSIISVYSKLHSWCVTNGLALDFATDKQEGDTLDYLKAWEKEGFRFVMHPDHDGWWTGTGGYVHDLAKVKQHLVETIRFFKTEGLCSDAKILVWPGSSNEVDANIPVVSKYCECAISVRQGGNPGIVNDRYQLQRIKIDGISSSNTKTSIKSKIYQALMNDEWVILYTHLYEVDPADTVNDTSNTFGNICDIVSYANGLVRLRSSEEIWNERKLMYDF